MKQSRWKQFSLLTLIVLITTFSIGFAWLSYQMDKAVREHEIVERYRAKAAQMIPDRPELAYALFSVYFDNESGSPIDLSRANRAPEFLIRRSSENLFSPLTTVHVSHEEFLPFLDEDIDRSNVEFLTLKNCFELKNLDLSLIHI